MTTITTPSVAPNDLIESSWGNGVRADLTALNADKLELAGGTLTGHVLGITPTAAAHLTRKDYVDGVVAGLLSASGGTVTGGSITIATSGQGVNLPAGEPSSAARATRKDYVDNQVATRLPLTGGTISGGSITIATSGQGVNLPAGEPSAAQRATRRDYVDNAVASRLPLSGGTISGALTVTGAMSVGTPTVAAHATRKDYVDTRDAQRLPLSGGVLTGTVGVNAAFPPTIVSGGAVALEANGRMLSSVSSGSTGNLWLNLFGGAAANGEAFAQFLRAGTAIGAIRIASASTVSFNTSSDPRLKKRLRTIDDALTRVRQLGAAAFRGTWRADGRNGQEWDFLSSHDIEDVAPYAVAGERDAVDDKGGVVAQQVDYGQLVPLLFAAVNELAGVVEGLAR